MCVRESPTSLMLPSLSHYAEEHAKAILCLKINGLERERERERERESRMQCAWFLVIVTCVECDSSSRNYLL